MGGYRISVINRNIKNMVGQITAALAESGCNIEHMVNSSRGEWAYTMLDLTTAPDQACIDRISAIDGVVRVRTLFLRAHGAAPRSGARVAFDTAHIRRKDGMRSVRSLHCLWRPAYKKPAALGPRRLWRRVYAKPAASGKRPTRLCPHRKRQDSLAARFEERMNRT